MRKKVKMKLWAVICLSLLGISTVFAMTSHYAFVLSCGETVFRTFENELTSEELLYWNDYYEALICGPLSFEEH